MWEIKFLKAYSNEKLIVCFLESGVEQLVKEQITNHINKSQHEFANARGVRNLMDQIILRQRARIVREAADGKIHTDEEILTVKIEDVIRNIK